MYRLSDGFAAVMITSLKSEETRAGIRQYRPCMSRKRESDGFFSSVRFCEIAARFMEGFTKVVLLLVVVLGAGQVGEGLNADGNALLDFKNGITSDPNNTLQTWNFADATPCAWHGVLCEAVPGSAEKHVVEINLVRSALQGTISPRLGDLAHLEALRLGGNKLGGQIPKELFLRNLIHLNLSDNEVTGVIPAEIRELQHLRVLDLSGNGLTGMPEDIRSCYRLQQLLLSKNAIASALPIGFGSNMTQLQSLDFSMNRFRGGIPDDFGNLTSLKGTLDLSNNYLSGAIPQSLANLQGLFIDLSNNRLSGAIPVDSYFQSLGEAAFSGNAALCGAPLETSCAPAPSPAVSSSVAADVKRLSKGAVIGIAIGCGALGLVMATLVVCCVLRKLALARKNLTLSRSNNRGFLCSWREAASGTKSEEEEEEGNLVHISGVLSFTLEELLGASAYVLSKSGPGIVYKAVLDEGTVVAVRRVGVAAGHHIRHEDFRTEVKAIAQVRHPNLVCLHSYSWSDDEKLLIYEYLSNGNLETALHSGTKGPMSWAVRIRVARGVAQGLAYIHECSLRKQYIHGNIKPSNILLDAFLEPRIADFGLQRLLALAQPTPVTEFGSTRGDTGTRISATYELRRRSELISVGVYQAPETVNAKRLSQKSDVYSFGVMLLELLTGRSPFKQLAGGELDLVSWMRMALQEKRALLEIFDPFLLKTANNQQSKMIETLQVALSCIAVNPESRPKMKQIAEIFELQASNLNSRC